MIQIIAGEKGKGKTTHLLEKANAAAKEANGSVVFIDKSTKHMYELDRKIRLINLFDYPIHSYAGFVGFLCGIISQDHDIEQVYLDSFLKLAHLSAEEIESAIDELCKLGDKFGVTFIMSISASKENLPKNAQDATIISL
ncbi:MAG: twitching motility protein PilT [Lachnospiraceae bacterium]|nr:twitching motility protein PilT [Candidatus Minthocola equi]